MVCPGPPRAGWARCHPWLHGLLSQADWTPRARQNSLSVLVVGQSGCQDGSEAATIPREQVKREQDELTCNFGHRQHCALAAFRMPAQHHSEYLTQGWEGPLLTFTCPRATVMAQGGTVGLHPWDLHEARRWPLLRPPVPPSLCSLLHTSSSPHMPELSSHFGPCAHRHTPTPASLVHTAGAHSTYWEQFSGGTVTSLCPPPRHHEPPWHTHSLMLFLTLSQAHTHNAHTCTHMPHMLQVSPQPGLTLRTGLRPGKASEDEDTGS